MLVPPPVQSHLDLHGFGEVVSDEVLHGGMASRTRRLRFGDGRSVVLKQVTSAPPLLYRVEAEGLRRLQGVPGWRVPAVIAVGERHLLLEDLGPQPSWNVAPLPPEHRYWEVLGRGLAHLHGRLSNRFGWEGESHWGLLPVDNRWQHDGHRFYADRLRAFVRLPNVVRHLPLADQERVERLAARMAEFFPAQPPCLLHGDLWAGNRGICSDGAPAVYDPFIHHGWPEWDLHGCILFGGFPARFYDAYRECHAIDAGWRERCELLGVMHLLAMLELVDSRWAIPWASRILARAVG